MRTRLVAAGVALTVTASAAVAAPAEEVTLKVERLPEGRVRYSGTISSGAANEYVAVLKQTCGSSSSTAVAGATTREGGFWETDPTASSVRSGTFRAQWKSYRSDPVTVRLPVRISLIHFRGGLHRVTVLADSNLLRRFVELQRLAGGRWTRVRRARLEGGSAFVFYTTFTVRKRGLRLRIAVPRKTAAPCHLPSVSETFVS